MKIYVLTSILLTSFSANGSSKYINMLLYIYNTIFLFPHNMMLNLLSYLPYRYKPCSEEQLRKAFEVLDQDNKGYLTTEELTKYVTESGEPFTQEEMEEMMSASVDPDQGVVFYKDYIPMMVVEES
jgi:Ca2+-binding EF-hand superfamily protein